MANLRGQGAFKGVNLIVHAPAKGVVVKNGKETGRFLDVQVDQSLYSPDKVKSGEIKVDTNPHLASQQVEHPNGGTYVSHRAFYATSQVEAMMAAAGDKKTKQLDNGDTAFGIQADVMKNAKGQLLVATDKPMAATKNPRFGKNILEKQATVTAAAKEARAAEIEAAKNAPEAAKEAHAVEQEAAMDEPEV